MFFRAGAPAIVVAPTEAKAEIRRTALTNFMVNTHNNEKENDGRLGGYPSKHQPSGIITEELLGVTRVDTLPYRYRYDIS